MPTRPHLSAQFLLGFIIYDQVRLNGTVSKSSFLFHTDNIIFIKLIFQEALFYSDFPEPGEIILFLPLGLKENLSITNVYQQCNFFCKKLNLLDIERKGTAGLAGKMVRKVEGKGRLPDCERFLPGQCDLREWSTGRLNGQSPGSWPIRTERMGEAGQEYRD